MDKFKHINCSETTRESDLRVFKGETSNSLCNKIKKQFFEAKEVYIGEYVCPDVWEIGRKIGEKSSTGEVFLSCCKEDCSYVLKKIPFSRSDELLRVGYTPFTKEQFLKEVSLQKKASEAGLAANIYQVFLNDEGGAFIMDSMNSATARRMIIDIIENPSKTTTRKRDEIESLIHEVIEVINKLHLIGIAHLDAHLNNFMKRNNSKESPWLCIDFGTSIETSNLQQFKEDYVKLFTDLGQLATDDKIGCARDYPVEDAHAQPRCPDKFKYINTSLEVLDSKIKAIPNDEEPEEESEEEKSLVARATARYAEYVEETEETEETEEKKELIEKIEKTIDTIELRVGKLSDDRKITRTNMRKLSDIQSDMENLIEKLQKQIDLSS